MLLGFAIVVAAALAVILAIAATKPATFRIERTASIAAPPERIFPLVKDFRGWRAWSPYEKLDPEMKRTFSGATCGKGAAYAWDGNSKAGAGRMEITDAAAPSKVVIRLDFDRPFKAHNVAEFSIEPRPDGSRVTWTMTGPNLFMGKVMSVFMNMDTLIGKDFEAGLANLKAIAEKT